jgi:hypothetical protein
MLKRSLLLSRVLCGAFASLVLLVAGASGQSIAVPWSGYGHDAQHSALSPVAAQAMNRILWQKPVDLVPQYSGTNLLIHYGTPLVTRTNTVVFPVKTGAGDGFKIEAHNGVDGALKWTLTSDYSLPPHGWLPSFGMALTPKNRLFYPGAGGTVFFRDDPNADTAPANGTGQIAFYGLANYTAGKASFDANLKINTPITSDRYGNLFFGFDIPTNVTLHVDPTNSGSALLRSGLARIAEDGTCTWVSASAGAQGDVGIIKVVHNCAPALSNDHKKLYFAVSTGNFGGGYLVCLDSRTLAPISRVRLKDVRLTSSDAYLPDDGTASPTVGPDGDVYFGVLEVNLGSNHYRGWLLHFNGALSQAKTPGAFGWDDTASIVPASAVPSYNGSSKYLLLTKYNNYAGYGTGGNGFNKVAILDPNDTMTDPVSGATVMKEVITVLGVTPDQEYLADFPGAVREWCINTAAIDPFTKCAIINSEDGKVYRWDFTTNALIQPITLTSGIGEAYTPTVIGVDGTIYAISNGTLFAVGQ